jgi:membrane-bound transcription factor site-1 protease
LNGLLDPFGIAFGDRVYDGLLKLGKMTATVSNLWFLISYNHQFGSGTSVIKFPKGGMLVRFTLNDQTQQIVNQVYKEVKDVPVLGFANSMGGRIAVFGDSTCLDSSHSPIPCFWLLEYILQYVLVKFVNSQIHF